MLELIQKPEAFLRKRETKGRVVLAPDRDGIFGLRLETLTSEKVSKKFFFSVHGTSLFGRYVFVVSVFFVLQFGRSSSISGKDRRSISKYNAATCSACSGFSALRASSCAPDDTVGAA